MTNNQPHPAASGRERYAAAVTVLAAVLFDLILAEEEESENTLSMHLSAKSNAPMRDLTSPSQRASMVTIKGGHP